MMAAMTERALADLLGDRFGFAITAGRATGGGQGRTYYADLAGTPVVLKWGLDPDLPEKLPYVAGQVPELRGRGIPVPRILAHGPLDDRSYGWVLERLAGTTATVLDEALLGDLMALIARMAGAPPGPHRNDMGYWVPAVVFEGPGREQGAWPPTGSVGSPRSAGRSAATPGGGSPSPTS
jgi:hypothetical protein